MSAWTATHPQIVFWGAWDCLLVSGGVCCCPELSRDTWRRWLWAYGWSVCMFMGFGCVFNTNRVFWSVQALYGAVNALYWKCLKRQNSTHLTPLKHQNTKTSLYKISKNQWVIMLLEIFGSVRRKLQSTVSLDHPVYAAYTVDTVITVYTIQTALHCLKSSMYAYKYC